MLRFAGVVQADRDGEGSPTESCMSMESIPMRKRSRKPKHVYNAADVAPLQAPWKPSTYKPTKKVHPASPCLLQCSSLEAALLSESFIQAYPISRSCVARPTDGDDDWRRLRLLACAAR